MLVAAIVGSWWISSDAFAGRPVLRVLFASLLVASFYLLFIVPNILNCKLHTAQALRVRLEAKVSNRRAILICRSFEPDGLAFHPAVWVHNQNYGRHRRDKGSYVSELAHAWAEGYLVAIGAPTKREDLLHGVGGLYFQTREEDWEPAFLLTAQSARFIWIIPGTTDGVMEEMRVLRKSGLTEKTIVFMPPQPVQRGLERVAREYCDPDHFTNRWKEAADRWRLEGCELPEYDIAGRIFTCNNDFSQRGYVRLNGATSQLRELLPQLVRTISEGAGLPISQLVDQLEAIECDPPKLPRIETFYIT
jgi:hypothetical protein